MIAKTLRYVSQNRDRIVRLTREGGWIVTGQIFSVVGTLVLVRVLTEYLSPAEYADLALGLTIAGLVNQVAMGGVSNGIGRFYSIATAKGEVWGYLLASRRLLGYATLAVGAFAALLMIVLYAAGQTHWLGLAAVTLVFSVLSGYNSALGGIQGAARQRAVVALHGGMDAWLKIAFAVAAMNLLGTSSAMVVVGYAISALLVTISQFFFLGRLLPEQVGSAPHSANEELLRQMWQFSWPFSIFGFFTWIQQVSDRWALETFARLHDVGQYAVLFQLGYAPIGMLTGLMMALLGPILYHRSGTAIVSSRNASVHRIAWRITLLSIALTLICFVFTWLFHAWLFRWLVADAYRPVSHYLPWVVLAGGLFAAGQMLSLKLMSEIRSQAMLQVKITTAILGVAANLLGAYWYGIVGVVAGLLIFSVVFLVWMILLAWHVPDVDL